MLSASRNSSRMVLNNSPLKHMINRRSIPRPGNRSGFFAFVGIYLAFLFVLFRGCEVQAQTSPDSNVQLVAALVDTIRAQDSIEATDVFLVPFQKEILAVAKKHSLPPALLAAFIQEESAFDQWATRTEPHYKTKKVVIAEARAHSRLHRGVPTVATEIDNRSMSYGLMQPMGQVAREQGYKARYLTALFAPFDNIEQGAIHLKAKLKRYPGDTLSAISAYNQGNNRRSGNDFTNARYVYRLMAANEIYKPIFERLLSSSKSNVKAKPHIRKSRSVSPDPDHLQHEVRSRSSSAYSNNESRTSVTRSVRERPDSTTVPIEISTPPLAVSGRASVRRTSPRGTSKLSDSSRLHTSRSSSSDTSSAVWRCLDSLIYSTDSAGGFVALGPDSLTVCRQDGSDSVYIDLRKAPRRKALVVQYVAQDSVIQSETTSMQSVMLPSEPPASSEPWYESPLLVLAGALLGLLLGITL
jgi:hypothetical protein